MREDSAVAILICGFLVFLVYAVWAFWRGADDANWEMRWRSLDDLDRAWIAAASLSSASCPTLAERGETELAKGCRRRERRHRAYVVLATLPLLAVAAALVLAGPLDDSDAPLLISSFALLQALGFYLRDRQIRDRYRQVQDRYLPDHLRAPLM